MTRAAFTASGGGFRGRPTSARRGFALPVVIALMLVVGVVSAIFLDRAATDRLNAQRQLVAYRTHHTALGVREVLSAWLTPLKGPGVASKLDPETGKALDLELSGGGTVSVFFGDGQGAALADLTKLTVDQATDGQEVLDELAAIAKGRPNPAWLRNTGPLKVSLVSAPEEVLLAVARAVARQEGMGLRPEAFVEGIMKARESEEGLGEAEVNTAAGEAGFGPEHRAKLNRLTAVSPTLWNIAIEVMEPAGRGAGVRAGTLVPTNRYLAGVNLEDGASKAAMGIDPLGPFLFWEELPIE